MQTIHSPHPPTALGSKDLQQHILTPVIMPTIQGARLLAFGSNTCDTKPYTLQRARLLALGIHHDVSHPSQTTIMYTFKTYTVMT